MMLRSCLVIEELDKTNKRHEYINPHYISSFFNNDDMLSKIEDYLNNSYKMVFISVVNNIPVDCDCNANLAKPDMHDVGILASTDPVALDQACVGFLRAVLDGASVIRRIQSRSGEHILDHADELGFGSCNYKLVSID